MSNRLPDITILVSAAAAPTMPGLLKCFTNNGERRIRTVGIDTADDRTVNQMVDTFYRVPPVTDCSYVDVVLAICKHERVDIYFPNISAEVSEVSKRLNDFQELGILVSSVEQKVAEIANNKLCAYNFLRENGIDTPDYRAVCSMRDYERGCLELGYPSRPVCLKMTTGSGSRGVRVITAQPNRYDAFANEKPSSLFVSYEEMLSILEEAESLDEMLLVEYMPGSEYTVDLLAENGRVLYMAGKENEVSLMSIAQKSVVLREESAYKTCSEIVRLLDCSGNLGFDFMRDADGAPKLMDINPRITATVSLLAAAGVNLPYLRIKQLLNEDLPVCTVKYGTQLTRRYGEYFANPDGTCLMF